MKAVNWVLARAPLLILSFPVHLAGFIFQVLNASFQAGRLNSQAFMERNPPVYLGQDSLRELSRQIQFLEQKREQCESPVIKLDYQKVIETLHAIRMSKSL